MKYHVPTGFGFSPKARGFYPFGDATDLAGEGGVGDVVWLIQASASNHKPKGRFFQTKGTVLLVCICQRHTKRTVPLVCDLCGLLEIRHATLLTTGAKHWHRQKAVFYVFCFSPPSIYPQNPNPGIYKKETRTQRVSVRVWNI